MGFLYREHEHSSRHRANDRRILDLVLARLRAERCDVRELRTADDAERADVALILAMSRARENLAVLATRNARSPVINDPTATLQTLRVALYPLLEELGMPLPETRLIDLAGCEDGVPLPYWLKRADYHHLHPKDVAKVRSRAELSRIVAHMRARGARHAYQQAHVPGRRVKFYGVFDRLADEITFLRTQEPADALLLARLRELAHAFLRAIPLEVFGGDVIVDADRIHLVDVNSWPSLSSCAIEGAEAIAQYVLRRLDAC